MNEHGEAWIYYSLSSPGIYSKLTSNMTGLFGATLGLPGAELRPLGNASCSRLPKEKNFFKKRFVRVKFSGKDENWHTKLFTYASKIPPIFLQEEKKKKQKFLKTMHKEGNEISILIHRAVVY